jgi:hypothetical protein
MKAVLKDVAVALCALAYSAAILGLAALMVLGTPGAPAPASSAAIEAAPVPLPANGKPLRPADRRSDDRTVEFRDL